MKRKFHQIHSHILNIKWFRCHRHVQVTIARINREVHLTLGTLGTGNYNYKHFHMWNFRYVCRKFHVWFFPVILVQFFHDEIHTDIFENIVCNIFQLYDIGIWLIGFQHMKLEIRITCGSLKFWMSCHSMRVWQGVCQYQWPVKNGGNSRRCRDNIIIIIQCKLSRIQWSQDGSQVIFRWANHKAGNTSNKPWSEPLLTQA